MQNYFLPVIVIYGLWNLAGFFMVMLDKRRAKRNEWRVRERSLFLVALVFGAAGIFIGMQVFRHKTRHWSFKIGIPILFILNVLSIYYLWHRF